jgi:hypothetical protein
MGAQVIHIFFELTDLILSNKGEEHQRLKGIMELRLNLGKSFKKPPDWKTYYAKLFKVS